MAAELVRRQVTVIAATGGLFRCWPPKRRPRQFLLSSLLPTIPSSSVLSRAWRGRTATLTGVNFFTSRVGGKAVGVPARACARARIAVLVNPSRSDQCRDNNERNGSGRARMGLQIQVFNASTGREIDAAFAALVSERPDACLSLPIPVFNGRRVQLVHLASRHALPAIYWQREFAEAGGLISYGSSIDEPFVRSASIPAASLRARSRGPAGSAVGQIRAGHQCPDRADARLTVPPALLARADEVIE